MDVIFIIGVYLLASFFALLVAKKSKVPVLLFFLALGVFTNMNKMYEDIAVVVDVLSSIALAVILFTGALSTTKETFVRVWKPSLSLATLGIVISTVLTGIVIHYFLAFPLIEAFIFGAVVSSTDAASVFNILGNTRKEVSREARAILEVESGCNDPMAFSLIVFLLALLSAKDMSLGAGILGLGQQLLVGGIIGALSGYVSSVILQRMKLVTIESRVILLAATILLCYSTATFLGGNGFLAIYLSGFIIGNRGFPLRNFSRHFFDTLSWLMQILLFIMLGLIISPNEVLSVAFVGMGLSVITIFFIRPTTVFTALLFTRGKIKEKLFISWAGLKGAVPIVFAIYVVQVGTTHASEMFHLTFFIVVFSLLVQGTLLEQVAAWLGVQETTAPEVQSITLREVEAIEELVNKVVVSGRLVGEQITQTALSRDYVIMSIKRQNTFLVPMDDIVLEQGDEIMLLERMSEQHS